MLEANLALVPLVVELERHEFGRREWSWSFLSTKLVIEEGKDGEGEDGGGHRK